MPKHKTRPHVIPHTNKTGISSPGLPPPDRGRAWKTTGTGSGSRPVPSKAKIETSAPSSQNRDYRGEALKRTPR
jgi:hypothetical protein